MSKDGNAKMMISARSLVLDPFYGTLRKSQLIAIIQTHITRSLYDNLPGKWSGPKADTVLKFHAKRLKNGKKKEKAEAK